MAIIKYKPTTPGRRFMSVINKKNLNKRKLNKKRHKIKFSKSGRNNSGRITVRHRGGRHKIYYRIIDFKRVKDEIPAKVSSIEYDPNRSCNILLVTYADGEKKYILGYEGAKIGDKIISGDNAPFHTGNSCQIKNIPAGMFIHNLEMKLKKGGQIARAAGTSCKIMGASEKKNYIVIRLASGEVRLFHQDCRATIGKIGNSDHNLVNYGKAGKRRHLGIRPTVRGSAMNPNDHPHGGGEGKTGIGRKSPLSPTGKKTLGKKTRRANKHSNKYIISKKHKRR